MKPKSLLEIVEKDISRNSILTSHSFHYHFFLPGWQSQD